MDQHEPRSADTIFSQMHRELRAFNPDVPESPERLDPILRILMQMYANQLASIDSRVGRTWEIARASLIRSMAPECRRWPVPAFTVMRCQPSDPAVEVDPNTRFYFKEKREGAQTLFFSPMRTAKILAAEVKHLYLKSDSRLIDIGPSRPEGAAPVTGEAEIGGASQLFVGVDYQGPSANLSKAVVFMVGAPEGLKQLRWSHWFPGNHEGSFYTDCDFCPGLGDGLEQVLQGNGQPLDWGGLRTTSDLFISLADSFAVLPERFTGTWDPGPVPQTVAALIQQQQMPPPDEESLYWIRVDLPEGGDRSKLLEPLGLYFDCFVAVNKSEETSFKHTGGNRLVELELPHDIESIVEITSVTDANNRDYTPTHQVMAEKAEAHYSLEERDNRLVLWFDFTTELDTPPDFVKVFYTVTAGPDANGIAAGKITELYDNHPGIESAVNVIPVGGAIPAKSEEQIVFEASSRLRSRDRALTFAEIADWARSFDRRLTAAVCDNGVQRFEHGVRRCIVVTVSANKDDFHSEDETNLLKSRLASFLKRRAPVNTQFVVEIELK